MVANVSLEDLELDRIFFNFSSHSEKVFAKTYELLAGRLIAPLGPNQFDNASSRTKELAIRAMIVLGAVFSFCFAGTYLLLGAAVLGFGSKTFKSLALYFQKDQFTLLRGSAKPMANLEDEIKILNWNVRGHKEVLHYTKAGVVHWKSRVDRICKNIEQEKPHLIVLQEVFDPALVEEIFSRLEKEYTYFYSYLGESGLMLISSVPLSHFSYENFQASDEERKRGFFKLEIPSQTEHPLCRIIGTQLTPEKGAFETRKSQIDQMIESISQRSGVAPTILAGSLYVNPDQAKNAENSDYLSRYLHHSYLGEEPTHSDKLVSQWAPVFDGQEETVDFVSLVKGSSDLKNVRERKINLKDSHLLEAFTRDSKGIPQTKTALSDSHGVFSHFCGLSK